MLYKSIEKIVLNILILYILHFHYIEECCMRRCHKNKCSAWRCLLVLHWWRNMPSESNRFLKKKKNASRSNLKHFLFHSYSFFSPWHTISINYLLVYCSLILFKRLGSGGFFCLVLGGLGCVFFLLPQFWLTCSKLFRFSFLTFLPIF